MGLITKPPLGAQINWGHPLAPNVHWAYAERAGRNSANIGRDTHFGPCVLSNGVWRPEGLHCLPTTGTAATIAIPAIGSGSATSWVLRVRILQWGTTAWTWLAFANPVGIIRSNATEQIAWTRASGQDLTSARTLPADHSHCYHIVATDTPGIVDRLYIDGMLDASANKGSADSGTSLHIGSSGDNLSRIDCVIEGLSIYNRALTAAEVAQLYADPNCFLLDTKRRWYSIPSGVIVPYWLFKQSALSGV